jgi:catechol 2,3-dioxygenase-like lactoylglutathione lyase family enzyme
MYNDFVAPINKIGIHINVKDFEKSKKFYLSLGFKSVFEYGPDLKLTDKTAPENYRGITFATPGGEALLEIADGHVAVKDSVFEEDITSSKTSLMIHVNSVHEIMAIAKENEITLAKDPVCFHWGTTEIVIKDPDGLILVFISPSTDEDKKKYTNK